jgi:putative photosynthetic complex assembly protein
MSVEIHFEAEPGSTSAMPQITPPKAFLRAAVAVAVLTLALAVAASRFGIGKSADVYGTAVAQRALRFEDAPDGGIVVRDAVQGTVALTLPPGTNGFIRGALRALAGKRRQASLPAASPFLLTAWDDGRVTIEDPLTRMRIAVSSFGPTQVRSFVALLDPAGTVVSALAP